MTTPENCFKSITHDPEGKDGLLINYCEKVIGGILRGQGDNNIQLADGAGTWQITTFGCSGVARWQVTALLSHVSGLTLLFLLRHVVLLPYSFNIYRRCRIFHIQRFQGIDDYVRYGQISEPLVVGRNDVPGRMHGAGLADGVFVSLLVVIPEFAL